MVPKLFDALLGSDVYGSLFLDGVRKGPREVPVARRTVVGWVVIGLVGFSSTADDSGHSKAVMTLTVYQKDNLVNILRGFWEQEEVMNPPLISLEYLEYEQALTDEHRRENTGRYIVRLPLRPFSVFQRVDKDILLNEEYTRFMSDYKRLGHMRLIPPTEACNSSRPSY
ncbi:uncharacterized protein LOC117182637 [Belonocnema kinseyi]|uniref:uncharacterized protein LOC117182637 n=1 Tax=Belonocnema kinseyi TaxID=2817044 RepID=UPI00143E0C8E|nr:uncharacterized protein LOC117182637 [Belonocnema kinseyi]